MPIIQRPLTKSCARRNMEEVYSCARSHKLNQRLIWIYSYVLGTFSGVLIALIMLKLVQYDNLIIETTRPAAVEISQPTFLAPSSSSSPLDLYNDVRILCFILTHPTNHLTKAHAVAKTWGKRCNKLVFISSENDESLDVITVNITEEHKYLWGKTKQGLQQIYELYGNDFDWYLKADDDTWIFMENLRHFLYAYSPSHPIYFGCKLKPYVKQGYMSGSSYVMSREAVRRFNEEALTDDYKCWNGTVGNEDVEIGKCLQNVGVLAGDSRDELGRWRFLPFTPEGHLRNLFGPSWLDNASYYEVKSGYDCCSESVISFHYMHYNQMYVFDFLMYHLKLYGKSIDDRLPKKVNFEQIKRKLQAIESTTTATFQNAMSSSSETFNHHHTSSSTIK